MKKKYILVVIVIVLLALYFTAAFFNKPYGPDIVIHNIGDTTVLCIVYAPGIDSKVSIDKKEIVHLKNLVFREGSIELEIDGQKTTLHGYCGDYTDGVIEVSIDGKNITAIRQKVYIPTFNWDLQ